jgi:2-phosphoglycerate kinase
MLEDIKVYWIGGSPCCGKSTISEMLVTEFGLEMYKCDDYLENYIRIGVKNDIEIMKKFKSMNLDKTWLRDVNEQVDDEFKFYREALKIIVEDLEKNYKGKSVLVEGAVILPEFIKNNGIDNSNYICMVPTEEFQIDKYSKREWIKYYLQGCSDTKKAFTNWMERDARYAEIIKKDADSYGMNVIVVDGNKSINDNYVVVKQLFGLI